MVHRIRPKEAPLRPDGHSLSADDFRRLRDEIAEFDQIEWIDEATREIVEKYMPLRRLASAQRRSHAEPDSLPSHSSPQTVTT
ncbi:hypothetical protein ACQR1W_18610 [Bradyrhizobium sp. HKCCYLS1011]|uniref:hypothetical protein n=1 Tax=Bradyrhizobium sp. HKCCYLS1011 TaxID=3420733 RepID=UPI003EC1098C